MPGTRAEAFDDLRRRLEAAPALVAHGFDRSAKQSERAFHRAFVDSLRPRLGASALDLDRWPADQPRAHGWLHQWTRHLQECSAVIVICSHSLGLTAALNDSPTQSWWLWTALQVAQQERTRRPQLPLLLILPEHCELPAVARTPVPTALLRVPAFERSVARRIEQTLVTFLQQHAVEPPARGLDSVVAAPRTDSAKRAHCPCGKAHDLRPILQRVGMQTTLELVIPCDGHETLVTIESGQVGRVRRSDFAEASPLHGAADESRRPAKVETPADLADAAGDTGLDAMLDAQATPATPTGMCARGAPVVEAPPRDAGLLAVVGQAEAKTRAPLYYEQFLREVESGANASLSTVQALLAGTLSTARANASREDLLAQVHQARVYVLSADAAECVERTVARLKTIPHFEPPVPSMWIEFEQEQIRLVNTGEIVRAITIHAIARAAGQAPQYEFRCWVNSTRFARGLIASPSEWMVHVGPCTAAPCPIADLQDEWMHAKLALPNSEHCHCAQAAQTQIRYIATLLTLLRADGVEHTYHEAAPTVATRQVYRAPHHEGRKQGRPTRRVADGSPAAGDIRTPGRVRWVRISLSVRRHLWRDQEPGSSVSEAATAVGAHAQGARLAQVAMHPRLLMPGPDKPWRGTVPRVVWVRSHQRRVYGERSTRYRVEP